MPAFARYPSLQDRAVFISGGATGIGAALVGHFAGQGARVAFVDRDAAGGTALADAIAVDGARKPLFLPCDVTDTAALAAALATAADHLGPIRVLVNNAADDAVAEPEGADDRAAASWDDGMAVNLRHHFFAARAVAPGMIRAGGGAIINMGSIIWLLGAAERPLYAAAKAAVTGLTRSLARRYGPDNVRVACVMPGAILTERQKRLWMTPEYEARVLAAQCLKRHLQPDEVARLVLFLASDDASACTGQSYIVDGGWA